MPDVITGSTQLSPTYQQAIATAAQKELLANAELSPFVTDVSQFAVKGNNQIKFPKLASFTVDARASGVAGEAKTLAASVDVLDLNISQYVSWLIDSNDEVQSRLDVKMEYAMRAASAHGRGLDAQIRLAIVNNAGYVATATALNEKIVDAKAFLKRNQANLAQLVIGCSPEQEAALLKVDAFVRAEYVNQGVVSSGVLGRLYGVPVIVSSAFEDDEIYMWEQSAVALGFQRAPNYASQPAIEYGTTAVREAMDLLAGVKALQIGQGTGTTAGNSGLIAKISGAIVP